MPPMRRGGSTQSLISLESLHGLNLTNRLMLVCPNSEFRDSLEAELSDTLFTVAGDRFRLIRAKRACAQLPSSFQDACRTEQIVCESTDNLAGLERLAVICIGFDTSTQHAGARSMLYKKASLVHI